MVRSWRPQRAQDPEEEQVQVQVVGLRCFRERCAAIANTNSSLSRALSQPFDVQGCRDRFRTGRPVRNEETEQNRRRFEQGILKIPRSICFAISRCVAGHTCSARVGRARDHDCSKSCRSRTIPIPLYRTHSSVIHPWVVEFRSGAPSHQRPRPATQLTMQMWSLQQRQRKKWCQPWRPLQHLRLHLRGAVETVDQPRSTCSRCSTCSRGLTLTACESKSSQRRKITKGLGRMASEMNIGIHSIANLTTFIS